VRLSNVLNFLNPRAPKGLIPCAAEWVSARTRTHPQLRHPQPKAWVKEIFPAEDNVHRLEYRYQPAPYEEFASVRWTDSPAASLFYLQDCRLLGAEAAVISPDNKVFAEFTLPPAGRWFEHACFRRRRMPPVKHLKGWYATLVWPESAFFFHWMMEALPRMAVLGPYADLLDGVFVPSPLKEFHKESLRLLGIGADKLIAVDAQSHFQPEHLFVPRAFAMYNPPRWLRTWYTSVYLPSAVGAAIGVQPVKRMYISRGDAPGRRVENEEEVLRQLVPMGFVAVRLSELSMAAQARMFHEADVIVAPHGAGLSNLVFCKSGTLVIEILPPMWMAPCFMALATAAGCDYRHIVAETIDNATSRPQLDNVRAPLGTLMHTLGAHLCEPA
jgi:capsular polysaccharide biosynthesis protein